MAAVNTPSHTSLFWIGAFWKKKKITVEKACYERGGDVYKVKSDWKLCKKNIHEKDAIQTGYS